MKFTTALVASILSFTTLDATAAAPTDTHSITVEYGDLNLDRPAGVAKLYSRIKGAARQACDEQSNEQMVSKQIYRACVTQAVSTAVARIDRPMLSDYVAQLGGKPAKPAPVSVAAR
jgi:UrcA family protein